MCSLPEGECERTWDHIVPVGWYPPNTPTTFPKVEGPPCSGCRSELGAIQDDLRLTSQLRASDFHHGKIDRRFLSVFQEPRR
jgi:hypothetical protein